LKNVPQPLAASRSIVNPLATIVYENPMDIFIFIFDQILSRIIGLFFIFFSSFLIVIFIRGLILGRASRDWKKVKGVVTDAYIERRECESGTTYYPKITYKYQIEGQNYEAHEWSYNVINGNEDEVQEIIDRHPVGHGIDVYYDPMKPSRAILDPGLNSVYPYIIGFILAAVFLVIGFLNLFKFWPFSNCNLQ
jgi:hypothetical protein